jgi:hypothetical protein
VCVVNTYKAEQRLQEEQGVCVGGRSYSTSGKVRERGRMRRERERGKARDDE